MTQTSVTKYVIHSEHIFVTWLSINRKLLYYGQADDHDTLCF